MVRVTTGILLLALLACPLVSDSNASQSLDGTLEGYLSLAQNSSPAIAAASARYDAARAKVNRAGGLPDPVVSYGHYFEEVETRVGPQVYRLGVRQKLPWFGKLSLAEGAASERAAAESERLRAARLDVAMSVTRAFAEYAYLGRAIEVTEERLSLLGALEAVVRSSYSSGSDSYGDVMKAQIGLARAEDSLASLLARRRASSSRLSAAVGVRDEGELPLPDMIPDAVHPQGSLEAALFEEQSPELLSLRHETEAARYEQRLARRAYFPDLTVGVDYIATDDALMPVEDSGKDPLIGVASISFPLWFGKHAAGVRQADSALDARERMTEQRTIELVAELRMLEFELDDAVRRVALYAERLVPAGEQSVAATDAAYRAGTADFDALVVAHEAALEFELALARSRADALTAAAELVRLTGSDY
ncbi:MAG: TolC family protein [Candidatus Eisenbacteria bacterium]